MFILLWECIGLCRFASAEVAKDLKFRLSVFIISCMQMCKCLVDESYLGDSHAYAGKISHSYSILHLYPHWDLMVIATIAFLLEYAAFKLCF